jgi:hypothetical protein
MAYVRRSATVAVALLALLFGTIAFAPEVLAFPYRAKIGDTIVYAEAPLPASMGAVLARSDTLLRTSAIYGPSYGRRIFLTNGGWRWHLLAAQTPGAFAFSRPLTEAIVVNRSDPRRDLVLNGAVIGGHRSLSGVIAHEPTHGLIRGRYGMLADMAYPAALREGYCDIVAGGGSLSGGEAAFLRRNQIRHPALTYYDGRRRVAALLAQASGNVDAVFAQDRR